MPKQKGHLKIEGTFDGLTYYHTAEDGYLVKNKSGVSKQRIKTDPTFVRSRENYTEFGATAKAAGTLRKTVLDLIIGSTDSRMMSRLVKQLTDIKNLDTASIRGQRTVAGGIGAPAARALLKGFNFNLKSEAFKLLTRPVKVDRANGKITINNVVPVKDINFPGGATHVKLTGAFARVDFESGEGIMKMSGTKRIPRDSKSHNISLVPSSIPRGKGVGIYLLKIEFLQQVNKKEYALIDYKFNSVAIIEVG